MRKLVCKKCKNKKVIVGFNQINGVVFNCTNCYNPTLFNQTYKFNHYDEWVFTEYLELNYPDSIVVESGKLIGTYDIHENTIKENKI